LVVDDSQADLTFEFQHMIVELLRIIIVEGGNRDLQGSGFVGIGIRGGRDSYGSGFMGVGIVSPCVQYCKDRDPTYYVFCGAEAVKFNRNNLGCNLQKGLLRYRNFKGSRCEKSGHEDLVNEEAGHEKSEF